MHMQYTHGVGYRKRGNRFRLGSGARFMEPRSTATPHCATSLWLLAGAMMLALVEASNGVNYQLDSTPTLSNAKMLYALENDNLGAKTGDFLGKNRGNAIPKKDTDSEQQPAPKENTFHQQPQRWRNTLGKGGPIFLWMVSMYSFFLMMQPGNQQGGNIIGPPWDPAGRVPFSE